MKISQNQMFRVNMKWALALLCSVLLLGATSSFAQGEALFKAKCATCHHPVKDGTGPKLQGVRAKWEENGLGEEAVVEWVQNWQNAAAKYPYAKQVANSRPAAMSIFASLKAEEIIAALDFVDSYVEPVKVVETATGTPGQPAEEPSYSLVWLVLAIAFIVIILSVSTVRRQLKAASGEAGAGDLTYSQELRGWAYKYKKWVGLAVFVVVVSLIVGLFQSLFTINIMSGYQPDQPIEFPHDRHTGLNGIDCKYCHNSVDKSKTAGIPTVNVCMNCHKQIKGEGDQVAKIQKIYDAAGFDPANGGSYSGETKPIVWNKVHNLPDHVYFNHSQHVTVGGIDCKQCHGDMTKQSEVARVVPSDELSAIEGNIKMTKPTLTMGWCIECHSNKEISSGDLSGANGNGGYYEEIHQRLLNNDKSLYEGYLEDGKVTVKELGGWECAKCHY